MEGALKLIEEQKAETFAKDEELAAKNSAIEETEAVLLGSDPNLDLTYMPQQKTSRRKNEIYPPWTHYVCDHVEESICDDLLCFERVTQCLSSAVLLCNETFEPEIFFTINKLRDDVVGGTLKKANSQLINVKAIMSSYLEDFVFETDQLKTMFEKRQNSHSKTILKVSKRINLHFDTLLTHTETGIKHWKACVQSCKECSLENAVMLSALSERQAKIAKLLDQPKKQHVLLAKIQLQQKAEIIEMLRFFEMFVETYSKMESIFERNFEKALLTAERLAFNVHKVLFEYREHQTNQMEDFDNDCFFFARFCDYHVKDARALIDKVDQGLVRVKRDLMSAVVGKRVARWKSTLTCLPTRYTKGTFVYLCSVCVTISNLYQLQNIYVLGVPESKDTVRRLEVNSTLKASELIRIALSIALELTDEKSEIVKQKRGKDSVLLRLKYITKIVELFLKVKKKKDEVAHKVQFILNKLLDDVVDKKLKKTRSDLDKIDEMISAYLRNVASYANNSITMFEEKEMCNSGVLLGKFKRISLDFDDLLTDCAECTEHWKACVQSRKEYSLKMTENILALSKLQDEIAKLQDKFQKMHLEQKEEIDEKLQDQLQKMRLEQKAKIDEMWTFLDVFTTLHSRMELIVKSDFENVQLRVQRLVPIIDDVFSMQNEHQNVQLGFLKFACTCFAQTSQCVKNITAKIYKVFQSLVGVELNIVSETDKLERLVEEFRVDSSNIYETKFNAFSSALNFCKQKISNAEKEVAQRKTEGEKEIETDA